MSKSKIEWADGNQVAKALVNRLEPFCDRIKIAGSIRRKLPLINDIEIVCIPKEVIQKVDLFDSTHFRVLGFGKTLAGLEIIKGDIRAGRYIQLLTPEGIKLDLFTAKPDNWGFIFAIRTGSADFSKFLASTWVQKGYKGIDGYLTQGGVKVPIYSEDQLFRLLDLPWAYPEQRNQFGLPEAIHGC